MNHHFDWIPGANEVRLGRKVEANVPEDAWNPDDFDSNDFSEFAEIWDE